ncbi:MAG: hypothetical protein CMM66_06935 [Rhodospirillaceae bacterium]|nr:hypothetical protein [Rhodospirillaceae bacterium]
MPPTRARLRQISTLVVLIIILAACSSTRLIYSLADEFIQDEIAYFLDLDEGEDVFLSRQVSEMVAWHRTIILPKYATYLTNMADKLAEYQYGAADIAMALVDSRSLIEETVTGLTPRASKVLVRHMTADNIAFMEKKMAVRRQERLAELSEPEDIRYADRLDRLKSNFERFFGELTDAQVALLKAHASATLGDARVRLRNMTQRQKAFLVFLKTQPAEASLTAYLNRLLLRGHEITDPGYQAFSKASFDRFRTLLVNMLAISSPAQRKTIMGTLRTYADDFKAVSS